MENLLTIDSGNTNTTVGLYSKGLLEVRSLKEFNPELNKNISTVLYSNVGENFKKWDGPKFINIKNYLKENALLDMPVNYSETIGDDRLASSYWVFQNWIKSKKVNRAMLVDAGTFTTIDLITQDGFEGGHIFPGTRTLMDSFKSGIKLPKLELDKPVQDKLIPKSTEDAMKASIQLAERGLYEKWWDLFHPEVIVLSGGLSSWHQNYFPRELVLKPNIVHLGLQELFINSPHQ
jgi:pantothenate kinase type III